MDKRGMLDYINYSQDGHSFEELDGFCKSASFSVRALSITELQFSPSRAPDKYVIWVLNVGPREYRYFDTFERADACRVLRGMPRPGKTEFRNMSL